MENIGNIPLFKGLNEDYLAEQSTRCIWTGYDANELVIGFEDDTTDVRFILSGRVRIILRVATGKEVILTEMGEGEYFGELAAIDHATRSANVTALQTTKVCIMPQRVFMQIVRNVPPVNERVLRVLAQRVRFLNARLAEHCFLQTKHRLYIELLRQSKPRLSNAAQRSISPPPTQKDIAARIGTRREVVSREIANLKRDGIVEKTTGALVLTDLPRLNALIHAGWEEAH